MRDSEGSLGKGTESFPSAYAATCWCISQHCSYATGECCLHTKSPIAVSALSNSLLMLCVIDVLLMGDAKA